MQLQRFVDKVALVTGGAQGIGYAVSVRLLSEGAKVVIADRQGDLAESVAAQHGKMAIALQVDVREANCGDQIVETALRRFGGLDLAVLCAGITGMKTWLELSVEEWNQILEINLRGTFLCLQAIGKQMIAQGRGGAMVTLAATSGHGPRPDAAHYGSSKAAIIHLTRSVALDLASHQIRVNAISPGIVKTSMWEGVTRDRSTLQGITPQEYEKRAISNVPLGRATVPEEIAGLAAFLLSDEAAYITGQVILQDGGYSLKVA
jgi:NAD(P)-dependent dehydrogenase (short-subunit alcohol dehydrogenase family)